MSNTYTWKILNLETIPSINGLENVVSVVRWLLTATNNGNVSTVEGTVELENPLVEEFIAYSDLTEEKVLEWTKLKLGNQETQYYQYLDEQLFKLARPQSTAAELPWGII